MAWNITLDSLQISAIINAYDKCDVSKEHGASERSEHTCTRYKTCAHSERIFC